MHWLTIHWHIIAGIVMVVSGIAVVLEGIRLARGVFREICNAAHIDRIERGERD